MTGQPAPDESDQALQQTLQEILCDLQDCGRAFPQFQEKVAGHQRRSLAEKEDPRRAL